MFLTDSHCHLNHLDLTGHGGDLTRAMTFAEQQGVKHFLCVCITLSEFPEMLEIANQYPHVSLSVGLHPNEQDVPLDPSCDDLVALADNPKVVAIGETGLDYFRSVGDVEWQRERFRQHIRAAKVTGKPLIVHTRQAKEDTLRILQEEQASTVGGVMHCFTEDWEAAQKALDMNFYISISGIVTFKTAVEIQDVAKRVPLDRLLIETDSPYLAPMPFRGKPNEPAYVRYVAECIANLRGISLETVAAETTENFFRLFNGAKR